MPHKPDPAQKAKPKNLSSPKITVSPPVKTKTEPAAVQIRCIYDSRLIVGADKTPSGTKYDFNPGQVKPVLEVDYQSLLAMETRPWGCCGGTVKPQKYFEAV